MYAQSCPTLRDSMDCSPPASSVHGILQAKILDCVALLSSRVSSRPRDQTCVSCSSCILDGFFTWGSPKMENTQWLKGIYCCIQQLGWISNTLYTKCKKADTKGYILHDSIYMTFWKRQNQRDWKQICVCQGWGKGRKGSIRKYQERTIQGEVDGNVLCLDCAEGTKLYTFAKTQRTVYLKRWMGYTVKKTIPVIYYSLTKHPKT